MFEMSPISFYTGMQPSVPLVDCLMNNVLIQTRTCSNQALFQIIDIYYRRAVQTFLQHTANLVVHRIHVGTVHSPQVWDSEMQCCTRQKCYCVTAQCTTVPSCRKTNVSLAVLQIAGSS